MFIIENLSLGYDKNLLFENFNLSLDSKSGKKIALVGPNGCGKSTLLKAVLKQISPIKGKIEVQNEKILHLKQHNNFDPEQMVGIYLENLLEHSHHFYQVDIALQEVDLDPDVIYKTFSKLSEGQKLKIQIIELLLQEPDILLLDEPTNHLDEQSINWLIKFIQDFKGSMILITHKQEVLEQAANEIWEIDPSKQKVIIYHGSFSHFWQQRFVNIKAERKSYFKLKKEIQRIRAWLKANEFHPKYRFSTFVANQKKVLAKLETEFNEIKLTKDPKLSLGTHMQKDDRNSLLHTFYSPTRQEIQELKIFKGHKILLEGVNGAGKTTLLKEMFADLKYARLFPKMLSQADKLKGEQKLHKYLNDHIHGSESEFYELIASFGLKPLLKTPINTLSGGEQKRVQIITMLNQRPNLMLLDEPTNHLDLFSQLEMIKFLNNTNATVIMITHEKHLLNNIYFDQIIYVPKFEG